MENIYVQFDCMLYQQKVGIPMGTYCALLIADLFLYWYERDFMSKLQKSKQFDLKDKFNDTLISWQYIYHWGIDNPDFAEHILRGFVIGLSQISSIFSYSMHKACSILCNVSMLGSIPPSTE